ncbi:RNA-binding protein [Alkalispirillum mobile]|uniref:RNA-binding protein n=1 Tax=Alkalispirillum mobile TaxID=85925 RepID=A0A498C700_9GAMM|nr:ribosome assembly RNA-binding protein YhbY [Alkalispirillum mobile]RLK50837.1 RNA-binding protein [Alkalispirillum mobile]
MRLNESQRRHLRRLAHDLKPVVRTGNAGLTEAVMAEIELALTSHELIKVKLVGLEREERQPTIEQVCDETGAELVQKVGQVAVLYRPNPERKPGKRISLP